MDEYIANVCDKATSYALDKIVYGAGKNGADICERIKKTHHNL